MSRTRGMIIGFDLGTDESQMSYFDRKTRAAVQISVKTGSKVYSFPTRLTWMPDKDEWHTGFEADYFAREKGGIPVPDLFTAAVSGARVGDKYFEGSELLAIFISESLKIAVRGNFAKSMAGLWIAVEHLTPALAIALRKAMKIIGFSDDQAMIGNYDESFYYYAYSQRPDVWNRGAGLIKFNENRVSFSLIKENKDTRPVTMQIKKAGETTLPAESGARDARFSEVLKVWLREPAFSGIFITGNGFGEWAKESLKVLSRGNCHVFAGDGLYSDGACFAAAERLEGPNIRGRIFMGPDMLRASCGMEVIDRGKQVWYPLREAGEKWFDRDASVDFILDGKKDITVSVTDALSGRKWNKTMILEGLPVRPERTTRIRLTAEAKGPDTLIIKATDLGFGELYPASLKTWEMEVKL